MQILQINTYDIQGGAARAAYRLHDGLRRTGTESYMVVKEKSSHDENVIEVRCHPNMKSPDDYYLSLVQQQYINAHRTDISNTLFSLPYPGHDISTLSAVSGANVINLHWVANFQSPVTLAKLLSLGKPVVWTLHDQWAFTGGCHYSAECRKYTLDCSDCPQLADDPFDLAAAILKDKIELFQNANLTIVTPSRWLAFCARESALFRHCRVEVIPYSLDTDIFQPSVKADAKAALGITPDSITMLFGAENGAEKRKGFSELMAAMRHCLAQDVFRKLIAARRLNFLCFGHHMKDIETLGLPVTSLGYLERDEDVRSAYAASDMLVLTSMEDNLPNIMLEAMSCGTPVIGFDTGGIPDVVENGVSGMVVTRGRVDLLGKAIIALLEEPKKLAAMGDNARRKAIKDFGLGVQASRYLSLYTELAQKRRASSIVSNGVHNNASSVCIDLTSGTHFGNIADHVLLKSLKETVPALRAELQAVEADRAARLDVIHSYQRQLQDTQQQLSATQQQLSATQQQLSAAQQQLSAAQQQLSATQQQLSAAQQQLHRSEADRAERLKVIHTLQKRNDETVSFKYVFKTIIFLVAVKLNIYNFLKRHESFFFNIYSWPTAHLKSIRSSHGMLPSAESPLPINSPIVEAFISARGLKGDIDERSLIAFFELGATLRNILCLYPSDKNMQALYMLSKGGSSVTCLSLMVGQDEPQLFDYISFHGSIAEWMTTGQAHLSGYDGLFLGPETDGDTLLLLKGRFFPGVRLFVEGGTRAAGIVRSLWGEPHRTMDGFEVYDGAPEGWMNAMPRELIEYQDTDWVLGSPFIKAPKTLASGRPWPKISVITVTYNQGVYLEQTIRSVLLQGYTNLEYIVIDGGSTDNTKVILERYRNELSHCVSEKDKGQSDALNKGFRLATGDILAWLNSDDRYFPWTLWSVAQAFDTYSADMVAGGCALINGDSKSFFRIHHNAMPAGKVVSLPLEKLLDVSGSWLKGEFFYQPEVFWSRELWERSGAYVDESLFYSMDYELWLRMAHKGARIVHVPDTLALYRVHEKQKTSGEELPYLPELRSVNAEFRKKIRER
jgi:glycosyltransferase involved in cell wall biosynthesis/GT2 family glycosyltransferase